MKTESGAAGFLSGVIEGFYGEPWPDAGRLELARWAGAWGLNTYVYAPKDDLHHRALWREPYADADAARLQTLIAACGRSGVRFVYALAPGLDVRYGEPAELRALQRRVEQLQRMGCGDYALLFDDIPEAQGSGLVRGGESLAEAQAGLANALLTWIRGAGAGRFLFCPTAYCGWMADAGLGGPGYLETLGRELRPGVDVFWTGPEIVSPSISPAHVRGVAAALRRRPVIWDNLHANDYDGRRFHCGPYSGRPTGLKEEVAGLLSNPNNELPLNFVPLRTLAAFVASRGSWDARRAYLDAMVEWHPRFATVGAPIGLDDLVLLGDCFYLPHEDGAGAVEMYEGVRSLLSHPPSAWAGEADRFLGFGARLRDTCTRLTGLRDRALFGALSRRVWELREELDLLERYVTAQRPASREHQAIGSPFHRPGTYRGSLVARLQALLVGRPDGTFLPAQDQPPAPATPAHLDPQAPADPP